MKAIPGLFLIVTSTLAACNNAGRATTSATDVAKNDTVSVEMQGHHMKIVKIAPGNRKNPADSMIMIVDGVAGPVAMYEEHTGDAPPNTVAGGVATSGTVNGKKATIIQNSACIQSDDSAKKSSTR